MSAEEHPPPPSAEDLPAGRSRSAPGHTTRALAILLLIVGLGGFVAAAGADKSHEVTSVADELTLGQKDPVTEAKTLRSRVTPVKRTFDAYAAARGAVDAAREDVTSLLKEAASASTNGSLEGTSAKDKLSKGIATYGAAVERERAARRAYLEQLTRLMVEVHP